MPTYDSTRVSIKRVPDTTHLGVCYGCGAIAHTAMLNHDKGLGWLCDPCANAKPVELKRRRAELMRSRDWRSVALSISTAEALGREAYLQDTQ
jgi:hypothetical protein